MISSIRFKWNKFSPPPKKTFTTLFAKGSLLGRCSGWSRAARFARVQTIRRPLESLLARRRIFSLPPPRGCAKPSPFRHSPYQSGNKPPAPPNRTGRGKTHIHTHTGIPAGWEGATHGCAGWGSAGCRCSHWMQQQRVEIPPHGCTAHDQLTSPPANCHHEILLR